MQFATACLSGHEPSVNTLQTELLRRGFMPWAAGGLLTPPSPRPALLRARLRGEAQPGRGQLRSCKHEVNNIIDAKPAFTTLAHRGLHGSAPFPTPATSLRPAWKWPRLCGRQRSRPCEDWRTASSFHGGFLRPVIHSTSSEM